MENWITVSNIQKQFDGVPALRGVSFGVGLGECVALVGENGAGKSTLMKILSGVWPHGSFSGQILLDGAELKLCSPLDGRKAGISIIHQELCLFPQLTVAENLFLTEEFPYTGRPSQRLFSPVRWAQLREHAAHLLGNLGFDVPCDVRIDTLSVAQRQLVEIARAFHQNARLLILDEPTSALSDSEVKNLFTVINRMRQSGMSFIYISHKLDEVFTLADRIVILRDGTSVSELDPKTTNRDEIVHHMVGRPLGQTAVVKTADANRSKILEVKRLSHRSPYGEPLLKDISFSLSQGEILGIAGLMGSGRSELLRSLLGILPGNRSGEIEYDGHAAPWTDMRGAMDHGIAFVPEDRKKDGLFLDLSIRFNTSIGILDRLSPKMGWLRLNSENEEVTRLCKAMGVKLSHLDRAVRTLSGGNQQKVLLAKMVALSPRVLLLDEPTRGIDIGAKEEIYEIIRKLADCGIAIILVSSELPEILALADRVLVLREGEA
ncbi:MAG: sugar ABC transporter ATP-binding protein, partial [Deltaproteobacteria bacterium]|nr:sugar ABC transporter ATP-binding protein [Deltaproteobacteria bacterium]